MSMLKGGGGAHCTPVELAESVLLAVPKQGHMPHTGSLPTGNTVMRACHIRFWPTPYSNNSALNNGIAATPPQCTSFALSTSASGGARPPLQVVRQLLGQQPPPQLFELYLPHLNHYAIIRQPQASGGATPIAGGAAAAWAAGPPPIVRIVLTTL